MSTVQKPEPPEPGDIVDERITAIAEAAVGADAAQKAQEWLEGALAVNLDEVTAEPIKVAFTYYKQETVEDEETGEQVVVNRRRTRYPVIETFVPMRIFNRMVAEREAIKAKGPDALLAWEADMVLAVWRLTEPQMTLDRLIDGLGYKMIDGLFARFFNAELQRTVSKA